MSRETKMMVDSVIQAMQERPDDFKIGAFTITDNQTDYEYWTSNGILSGGVYCPYKMSFGLIQSIRFHRALAKFRAERLITANSKACGVS